MLIKEVRRTLEKDFVGDDRKLESCNLVKLHNLGSLRFTEL